MCPPAYQCMYIWNYLFPFRYEIWFISLSQFTIHMFIITLPSAFSFLIIGSCRIVFLFPLPPHASSSLTSPHLPPANIPLGPPPLDIGALVPRGPPPRFHFGSGVALPVANRVCWPECWAGPSCNGGARGLDRWDLLGYLRGFQWMWTSGRLKPFGGGSPEGHVLRLPRGEFWKVLLLPSPGA